MTTCKIKILNAYLYSSWVLQSITKFRQVLKIMLLYSSVVSSGQKLQCHTSKVILTFPTDRNGLLSVSCAHGDRPHKQGMLWHLGLHLDLGLLMPIAALCFQDYI